MKKYVDRIKAGFLYALIACVIFLTACGINREQMDSIFYNKEDEITSEAEVEQKEESSKETSDSSSQEKTEVSDHSSEASEESKEESKAESKPEEPETPKEIEITVEPRRFSGYHGTDLTPDVPVRSPLILTTADVEYYPEVNTLDYYYTAFDEFRRKMYEAMIDLISHTNEPGYRTYFAVDNDQLWKFADEFYLIMAGVMDDHPELFRYDEIYALSWDYDKVQEYDEFGNRRLYLYQTEDLPGFWEELEELDNAAEEFLSDIDRNQGEYDLALQIHDKLIDLVRFPTSDADMKNGISYQQTAYGALIDNGEEVYTAVCEGYSDAYSYLLRRCGIMCIPIAGSAGQGTSLEEATEYALGGLHEWNLMLIDGEWYETDTTFDDYDTNSYDYVREVLAEHPDMLWGLRHYFFAVSPEDMYDLTSNEPFVYYTDESGQDYSLMWDHSVHIRASDPRARELSGILGDVACFLPDVSYDQSSSAQEKNGWIKEGGAWYYYEDGVTVTGWRMVNSKWYYFNASGAMQTGWQTISGKTYFFKDSGVMAANEWCDGWWLDPDGTWTYKYRASWKKDSRGWYYQDTSGWFAKNTTITIDDQQYTFDADGYMK